MVHMNATETAPNVSPEKFHLEFTKVRGVALMHLVLN